MLSIGGEARHFSDGRSYGASEDWPTQDADPTRWDDDEWRCAVLPWAEQEEERCAS